MSAAGRALPAGRPLLRQALLPVAALGGVVLTTVAGFVLLAGVGVVEAAYWIISPASVGLHFRENTGPETATKAFAVLSRVGLVVVGLWLGQTVVSALFGGQITEELKRVQQERTIGTLSEHVVVCGYGMFGQTIAERLEGDRQVVVVEHDEDNVVVAEREGHLVVDGDARQEATLERANVESTATVVAAVDDSNVNLQIAIVANQLAPGAELIVRIGDRMYESTARRAGADVVVIPEIMSGDDVADHLVSAE
jgi:voltage-gated potassium channel